MVGNTLMSKYHAYVVFRPYCYPGHVVTMAVNKKRAVEQVHKVCGFTSDTTAQRLKPRQTVASTLHA